MVITHMVMALGVDVLALLGVVVDGGLELILFMMAFYKFLVLLSFFFSFSFPF